MSESEKKELLIEALSEVSKWTDEKIGQSPATVKALINAMLMLATTKG
jgi:hypothetical protein